MKARHIQAVALAFALLWPATVRAQQTAQELYQTGLYQEEVQGNLERAIQIFKQLVEAHGDSRPIAAQALVRLGQCYEKLGREGASQAYQRVIRDYADQPAQVTMARARLDALSASASPAASTGPTVRRLWSGDGVNASGAPTRDGRLLTFTDWDYYDVAVRDLATGESHLLTKKDLYGGDESAPLRSTPSPDGRRVAYGWSLDTRQNAEATRFELRLVGIDGGEPLVLYADPEIADVRPSDWSPDGNQIVTILTRRDHTTQIALIGATDGAVRILKTLDSRGPGKTSFSPDGRYLVYDRPPRADAEQRDIYVLATDGGAENALVQNPAHDVVMGWAPDGRHVLFASDRTGDMSVWLAPVADGKPTGEPLLVRRDAEFATAVPLGFTQNGAFLYGVNASVTDMYVASIDPSSGRATGAPALMVDHFVGANREADWTPDGTAAVYVSKRQPDPSNNSGVLIVRTLATGAERVVPARLDWLRSPRWSPDGRYIVGQGQDRNGRRGIFRVDPQSGEATMLVEDDGRWPSDGRWFAGWSADATSIIYRIHDPLQPLAIVSQRLDTGESKTLFSMMWEPNTNLYGADVSPDGRQVAFASVPNPGDPTTLRVVSSEGGEARTLFQAPSEDWIGRSLAWSTDSRYIFFVLHKKTRESSRIMRVAATGGPAQETGVVVDGMFNYMRPHPDGRRMSFTAYSEGLEVWIMENFLPKAEAPAGGRQR
ncbi:MAG: tetratricopeptide repeat protein [Longimicrobiales bacterium]|nr:tetratricopeptide repeat protein [Longimicrobiales bacterium]